MDKCRKWAWDNKKKIKTIFHPRNQQWPHSHLWCLRLMCPFPVPLVSCKGPWKCSLFDDEITWSLSSPVLPDLQLSSRKCLKWTWPCLAQCLLLFPAREIFISVHSSNKQANSPAISKVSASQLIFVCVSQSLKSFSRGAAGLTWMGFRMEFSVWLSKFHLS